MQFGCCYNYAVDMQGRPPGALLAAGAAATGRDTYLPGGGCPR